MKFHFISCLIYIFISFNGFGQNKINLKATFDIDNEQIKISQTITYKNTSKDTLQTIFLNDWNNSYSSKNTPLAIRLADEYKNVFHLAKDKDRGYSEISFLKQDNNLLEFETVKNQPDIIKVLLNTPIKPNESYTIHLKYTVHVPSDKFTEYGISKTGDMNLRYWYITPAVYNGEWQYYSNKDLDDLFIPKADIHIEAEYPIGYTLTTELNTLIKSRTNNKQTIVLAGENRTNNKLFLNKIPSFKSIETQGIKVVSNINGEDLEDLDKAMITERIIDFMLDNLGEYPHEKLLLTSIDNSKDPVYGLNFLPSFLKPYPHHFQYELRLLKVALYNYLENTLLINPRKHQWLIDGLQIYYLMNYVELYYPDMKFLGSFAKMWGIRSFHAADMDFNDKYNIAFMIMGRTNKDQPLTMQKDSLLKFNKNIANKYKAGLGLKYLDDFINSNVLENSIKSFLNQNKLKETTPNAFENYLKSNTHKNIDWFFTDYLKTRKKIDFKIKNVTKTNDSITLTVKNKRNNSMPISLYALNNDSIISKLWIENVTGNKTITIPYNNANKLVLNYDKIIPETNIRDNWKSLKGFFFNNKPLQFRLFKDIEDPHYNQVFLMPLLEFNNIYDGFSLGMKMYNKTILRKHFDYRIEPKYAFKSKSLTGAASASITHNLENNDLFFINYGIRSSYTSYADDLFVSQITPSLTLLFRQDNDFRSNKRKLLMFRHININRDKDPNNPLSSTEPNYSVFNIRYINSNDNLINFSKWHTDFQVGKTFSKIAFNYEYRRLFQNNRQLNLRFYAGTFLRNDNDVSSDYFSFALDRPTDYLFDYAYLGRSESSGIFSQQYITAEGGFKSKLDTPYANQWITTLNTSTTLWKYILLYGDAGFVKNKSNAANFVYDSGIRINLVTDYFEIYLPLYSNLGWEIGQPHYDQKIRFKFTIDPESLLGLFRRRWF